MEVVRAAVSFNIYSFYVGIMRTRREFVLAAAGFSVLAGCMDSSPEGNTTDGGGGNGDGDGATDGDGDGGQQPEPEASLNVNFDSSQTRVVVTLTGKTNAEYVDVVFGRHASAKGRLYEVGDELVLGEDALNVSGMAEERTRDLGVFSGANPNDEIRIVATAVSGDRSTEVLNRTDTLGSRFVQAQVSYGADEAQDQVLVLYSGAGDAEYVRVEFGGDANAVGRLNTEGDRLVLTPSELLTEGDAEVVTGGDAEEFDGADDGDTVSIRAIAVSGNRRNVVTLVDVSV